MKRKKDKKIFGDFFEKMKDRLMRGRHFFFVYILILLLYVFVINCEDDSCSSLPYPQVLVFIFLWKSFLPRISRSFIFSSPKIF